MVFIYTKNDFHDPVKRILEERSFLINGDLFVSKSSEPLFVFSEESIKLKRVIDSLELIVFDTRLLEQEDADEMFELIKNIKITNSRVKFIILTDSEYGDILLHKLVTLGVYNILNFSETYGSDEIFEEKFLDHISRDFTLGNCERYFITGDVNQKISNKERKLPKIQTKVVTEKITVIDERIVYRKSKKIAVVSPFRKSGTSMVSLSLAGFLKTQLSDKTILVEYPNNTNSFYRDYFAIDTDSNFSFVEYIKYFKDNKILIDDSFYSLGGLDLLLKVGSEKISVDFDTMQDLLYSIQSKDEYEAIIVDMQDNLHDLLDSKIFNVFDEILIVLDEDLVNLESEITSLLSLLSSEPQILVKSDIILNRSIKNEYGKTYSDIESGIRDKYLKITSKEKTLKYTFPLLSGKDLLEILSIKDSGLTPYEVITESIDKVFSELLDGLYKKKVIQKKKSFFGKK